MRRTSLRFALLVLALAPGTWLRSDIKDSAPVAVSMQKLEGPNDSVYAGWRLEGLWKYEADHLWFGGFSALMAIGDGRLRAFSDRGMRFTLTAPDKPQPRQKAGQKHHPARNIVRQLVAPHRRNDLLDIESATRDPETGQYWLGFEGVHTIHRYKVDSSIDGLIPIRDPLEWGVNSGAEAMVRLEDGRFLVLPEGRRNALMYPSDPVEGAKPERFMYKTPLASYAAVDVAQLPDGRLLILLRNVEWAWPPFASALAIGPKPPLEQDGPYAPEVVLDLNTVLPNENYEGLALREQADGRLDVWIISDDNNAVIQRTLLAKLSFDPALKSASKKTQR
ncbi:MAG: esterase-like activity of phytase family protein [Erythrobacter sp.]